MAAPRWQYRCVYLLRAGFHWLEGRIEPYMWFIPPEGSVDYGETFKNCMAYDIFGVALGAV